MTQYGKEDKFSLILIKITQYAKQDKFSLLL